MQIGQTICFTYLTYRLKFILLFEITSMNQQNNDAKALHDFYAQTDATYVRKNPTKANIIFILISLSLVASLFVIPKFFDYLVRARVGEGIALAIPTKTLIIENAVSGLPFDHRWQPITPTAYTQSMNIGTHGEITIESTDQANGAIIRLTPIEENGNKLIAGKIPANYISWKCEVVSLGTNNSLNSMPSECRTFISE